MHKQNQPTMRSTVKKILACIFLSGFLFCSFGGSAQSLRKKFSIGFGLEAGLPEGDVKYPYDLTAGFTVRFSYRLGHGFATFTTGVIGYVSTLKDVNLRAAVQVPFKAGYKYIIGRHLFVIGEVGYSDFRAYYDEVNGRHSTDNGGFTYAPTVGVQFGALELGVRYETVLAGGLNIGDAGLRLGFNF
jgi:hypothetical protein